MLNKRTTGTISFITSLVWRGPWLGIEPGTSRTRSQHSTTRLSRRRFIVSRWLYFIVFCKFCYHIIRIYNKDDYIVKIIPTNVLYTWWEVCEILPLDGISKVEGKTVVTVYEMERQLQPFPTQPLICVFVMYIVSRTLTKLSLTCATVWHFLPDL